MKRIVSACLVLVMLLSFMPLVKNSGIDLSITAHAAGEGVYAKLNSLRSKFPDGYFWNHKVTAYSNNGDALFNNGDESFADSVTGSPCATHNGVASVGQYDCNYFDGGIQCFGFAGKVFYDVFGQRKSGLQKIYNNNYGVSVGDYVRVNNDTHSAVVLSRSGDYITVVECNLSGGGNAALNCKIRWDATYPISSITYYCHATNYSSVDSSGVNYFQSVSASNITTNDAKIEASIIGTNLSTCGFYIGTEFDYIAGSMTKVTETVNGYVEKIYYNLGSDYGQLYSGATYYYKFFITVNGVEYCSEIKSFETQKVYYTVTFDANGGSVSPTNVKVAQDKKTTLPTPTKSFEIIYDANGGTNAPPVQKVNIPCRGWATTKNATSVIRYCGSSYFPTSDVTLFALWQEIKGVTLTNLIPERAGYNFVGWSKSSTATSASYGAGKVAEIVESVTLYAVWEKQTTNYTVTYNANGGILFTTNETVEAGKSTTLPTTVKFYEINYNANGGVDAPTATSVLVNCLGWSTNSNATSATYGCESTYKPTGNVTLYAVWETSSQTYLNSQQPTRDGYKFLGWSKNSNSPQADFSAGEKVNVSGDTTLYAVWQKIETPKPELTPPTVTYENVSLNYKDSMTFNVPVTLETSNSGVASVSGNKISAVGTGSADVTATFADGSKCVYHVNVSYTWWQWIIVIVLFGWIWY